MGNSISAQYDSADTDGGRKMSLWRPLTPSAFQLLADFVSVGLVFLMYMALIVSVGLVTFSFTADMLLLLLPLLALTGYWQLLFWLSGLYKNWYIRSPFDEYFTIARISFIGCCLIVFVIWWDEGATQTSAPRLIIALYWLLLVGTVCTGRLIARSLQRRLREKLIISIPVVLVGCVAKLRELLSSIEHAPALGYRPVGAVVDTSGDTTEEKERVPGLPVLGELDSLPAVLDRVQPQEVLVAMEHPDHEGLMRLAAECSNRGIRVKILPDLYEIFSGQARTMQIYGTPLIEVSPELLKPWEEVAKRLLDIVVSILVLVVGLPFWLLVALVVRLDSTGPVLFRQERVGKNGRPFMMYKFRSMTTDAEKNGPQWAKVNDPRVTRSGRFLRKTHIDEVPQFWNVLLGEMSLVGPRPERPFYVEKFSREIPYYPRRLKVRPGITGWYQIKYLAYEETLDEVRNRLRYDFFYIENMSFKLDIEILIRTAIRVFKGHGQA